MSTFRIETGSVVATLALLLSSPLPVSGAELPGFMAIAPDGRHVYVTLRDGPSTAGRVVTFFRNENGTLGSCQELKDGAPCNLSGASGIAASPDGRHVYVAASVDGAVQALEWRCDTERPRLRCAASTVKPELVGIGDVIADERNVYVSHPNRPGTPDGEVFAFSTTLPSAALSSMGSIPLNGNPARMALASHQLYVANAGDVGAGGGVSILNRDPCSGRLALAPSSPFPLSGWPYWIHLSTPRPCSANGGDLYVAGGSVVQLGRTAPTGNLSSKSTVSVAVKSMTVRADGRYAYFLQAPSQLRRYERNDKGELAPVGSTLNLSAQLSNPLQVVGSPDSKDVYVLGTNGNSAAIVHVRADAFAFQSTTPIPVSGICPP